MSQKGYGSKCWSMKETREPSGKGTDGVLERVAVLDAPATALGRLVDPTSSTSRRPG